MFLRNGRHPLLAERAVGARAVFSKAEAAGRRAEDWEATFHYQLARSRGQIFQTVAA